MSNFEHKSCCPDGEKAEEVATAIQSKIDLNNGDNPLLFLLDKPIKKNSKHLEHIDLKDINDFVRLSAKKLCNEVYFGTFQMKLSLSYIGDLVNRQISYMLSNDFVNGLEDSELKDDLLSGKSKVILVTIPSRHQRGQKQTDEKNSEFRNCYKVFLQYIPGGNCSKSIQSIRI